MFLFFPVAAGLKNLLDRYSERSRPMVWLLAGFITLLVVGLGTGTYIRNQVWSSGQLLWEDAAGKAPESSRPLHNLAWDYYERIGDYTSALEIYRRRIGANQDEHPSGVHYPEQHGEHLLYGP